MRCVWGAVVNHKNRIWTEEDEECLRDHARSGMQVNHIAQALDRNMGAVIAKMVQLGMPIPRTRVEERE
jgi:hypothetical protein